MTVLDCACIIHGDKYDWIYVDRLYDMVRSHLTCDVRFHVFTESSRTVPDHMIKHCLTEWPGISGPRKSWWYKMQLFDPSHIAGRILYLDLDVVITGNLDWMQDLSEEYFWTIRDWRYLWRPYWDGMNSSVMLWDTRRFQQIWDEFRTQKIDDVTKRYHGDQDYLDDAVQDHDRRFFPDNAIKSWRWQIKDGGWDFKTRTYKDPASGSTLDAQTKILVFHGKPKPHEIDDPIVEKYWNPRG